MAPKDKPGRRSGGPRSPAGKARSAQNARTHGLCSQLLVLTVEDRAALEELARSFAGEYEPVGATEEHLVSEMVSAAWREYRCQALESAAIDIQIHRGQQDVDTEFAQMDGASRAALAVERISPDGARLVNFARYETSFHRIFHRALKQLLELQDRRSRQARPAPPPVTAPEPIPEPGPKLRNEQPPPPAPAARELRSLVPIPSGRLNAPG